MEGVKRFGVVVRSEDVSGMCWFQIQIQTQCPFSGVRLGWTVCPKALKYSDGTPVSVESVWCG